MGLVLIVVLIVWPKAAPSFMKIWIRCLGADVDRETLASNRNQKIGISVRFLLEVFYQGARFENHLCRNLSTIFQDPTDQKANLKLSTTKS